MTDFPTLENFFAAYFHQDWAMEHDSVPAVVAHYRSAESDSTVATAREELARLMAEELDSDALAARVRDLGCEYHPADGEWRGFLDTVAAGLSGQRAGATGG